MDFRKIEKKWQERWERTRIFEADPDPKKQKFFMTVPYPYTSGPLHIGHGRTYTIGDVFVRFMRMRGFNTLWPMAFHITGTPILAISARIEMGDKETIELYKSYVSLYEKDKKKIEKIVESFKNPWNVANFFANVISSDYKALGFSIDWRRSFTTGDEEYTKFVQWQFRKLKEKGLIIQGTYPILFCLRCDNAVGEDDIKSGDVIKPEIGEYTLIKYKMDNAFLVAATLRPETVFGVTNIWIKPTATYVKAKFDDEVWIISKEASEKLAKQNRKLAIVEELEGKKLVGKYVKNPIDEREIIILPADFVDPDEATGVVYSVPAHAPWDWIALKEIKDNPSIVKEYGISVTEIEKVNPISIIKIEGYGDFPAIEECKNLNITSQADKDRINKATETIYKKEFYHGVMKDTCGSYSGLTVQQAKEKITQELITSGKADKMYEVMALKKPVKCRCGGKVIVAVLPDQWFIDYDNAKWKEDARKCLAMIEIIPKNYRKQFEDTIEWLHERPCARKRGLGTKLPFDENWIIESLSDSTIYMAFYTVIHLIRLYKIKPKQLNDAFWDYVFLGEGDINDVSKSTGISKNILEKMRKEFDYWYPNDHRHTAIGHISNHLTFFIFNHTAIFPEKYWPKKITLNEFLIREGRKMSKSLGNVIPLVEIPQKYSADLYRLYIAWAAGLQSVFDWREREIITVRKRLESFFLKGIKYSRSELKVKKLDTVSKWMYTKLNMIIEEATRHLEKFEIRNYVQKAFFDMMNYVSYYEKRETNNDIKNMVMHDVFEKWIRLLAPVIPHTCEELWEELGNKDFVSIAEWPKFDPKKMDKNALELEENFRNTCEDIKEVIRLSGKKKKLYLYPLTEKELKYLEETKEFLKKEFGFEEVKLFKADDPSRYDPENKAKRAKFGKPGIYIE
jgi:leucyl-tRNA synthetase